MKPTRKTASWICSVFGFAALLMGPAGQTAARADDGWRYDQKDRIATDRRSLREDEDHLRHLERRLDDRTLNHDRRGVRDTRRDIERTRADIDRDHRNLERDYGRHDDKHNHE